MSNMQEKDFSVDGAEYKLTPLGALEGRRIWLKLVNKMGPAVKALGTHERLNEAAFVDAFAAIIEGLDEETTEMLYKAFQKTCRVKQGEKWPLLEDTIFDIHFSERYVSMTKWLFMCVKLNFAGFLGDGSLGRTIAGLQAAVSKRVSQKDSTGSSGVS